MLTAFSWDSLGFARIPFSLQELPFDTGSFDMVHIRFVGLGVPESSWSNLFFEASRVLKRGTGVMEVGLSANGFVCR